MKKLKGTDFLVLNANIIDKTQDPKVARQALRILKDLAPELGLPGTYLRDSLARFLDESGRYRTLEQAFGLKPVVGPPVISWSKKDADIAYKCFERRLKGELAKQLEYKGYSKRKLTEVQSRYLFSSIYRAREKRSFKPFTKPEVQRLERILKWNRPIDSKIAWQDNR